MFLGFFEDVFRMLRWVLLARWNLMIISNESMHLHLRWSCVKYFVELCKPFKYEMWRRSKQVGTAACSGQGRKGRLLIFHTKIAQKSAGRLGPQWPLAPLLPLDAVQPKPSKGLDKFDAGFVKICESGLANTIHDLEMLLIIVPPNNDNCPQ